MVLQYKDATPTWYEIYDVITTYHVLLLAKLSSVHLGILYGASLLCHTPELPFLEAHI